MVSRSGPFAEDERELGAWMKRCRGRRSLRAIEGELKGTEFPLTKSTLNRYEHGKQLPSVRYADVLDQVYAAEGWLLLSIHRLWRSRWDPWADEWPQRYHSFSWPADYRGMVWMKVLPTDREEQVHVSIDLEWGPWGRVVECVLPPTGIVLRTGKAQDRDGISRPLNFSADQKVFVLFGAGEEDLAGESVLDIHRGWEIRNRDASPGERWHGPDDPDA